MAFLWPSRVALESIAESASRSKHGGRQPEVMIADQPSEAIDR
jgi:hypothetical protein